MTGDTPTRWVTGVDGVRLAVDEPTGDRAVLLVGHGVGSSVAYLRDTFGPPVSDAGLELVTWSLRGHGDSDPVREPARHALDLHAGDVAAVASAVGAAVVVGVSLAGHAAVAAVARGLVTACAVVACLPAWTGRALPGVGVHAAVAAEIAAVGVGAVRQRFPTDPGLRPWLRDVLVRDWARSDAESLRAALLALDGGLAPTLAELAQLPVGLGVVAWPDDPGHPLEVARAWAAAAPRSHLEQLDLADPDADPTAMGRAAIRALAALGVT